MANGHFYNQQTTKNIPLASLMTIIKVITTNSLQNQVYFKPFGKIISFIGVSIPFHTGCLGHVLIHLRLSYLTLSVTWCHIELRILNHTLKYIFIHWWGGTVLCKLFFFFFFFVERFPRVHLQRILPRTTYITAVCQQLTASSSWNFLHSLSHWESLLSNTPGRTCWAYSVCVSHVFWIKKVKGEKNSHKCLKVFVSNEGAAAAATADDVYGAHLCGYTVSLPSTKSCSDANVWEIHWWFTYFHFCITDRHVSHCRHCGIKHFFSNLTV